MANDGSDRRRAVRAPALLVLNDFDDLGSRVGHENAGFLSVAHGFMPRAPPLGRLAARFAAWDQLASQLPALHRSLQLRKSVEQLPLLDASHLEPHELLRACALLAIVSHAYWYVEPSAPRQLPEALRRPWAQLRERLGRKDEVLSYIDLIVYNWRLIDAGRSDPLVVENLQLLFPTIGNREERVFYLTQLEILARASPIVAHTANAQDAVLREDHRAVEASLEGIIASLSDIVRRTLLKLDPNPYSPTYVDPVVWAKTVAPLAVPFHTGVQGPSGTSSPLFNTLDLFFGRKRYETFLGREIKQLRATYPRAWQSFLGALTQVSVADYVQRSESRALQEAWSEALDLYAGQTGFLGRHRMKVYGYLELAFKVGRSVTIGGFGGVFKDRTWDLVDNELVAAQAERPKQAPGRVQWAKVIEVDEDDPRSARVGRVVLDVAQLSLRYRPGDRCLVLPENDQRTIERTLRALHARGDEPIALTDEWRQQLELRGELAEQTRLPLREVLRFGSIRPVSARLAEALHAHSQSPVLLQSIVDERTTGLELWELLGQLEASGLDPRTLWLAASELPSERLCRLIPPLRFRIYSISSVAQDALGTPNPRLELTVSLLRYAGTPALDGDATRRGTASTFLLEAKQNDREVSFLIERPDRFVLPDDPSAPVLMFAGGSGVSPFRAFLQARARAPRHSQDWLFLSLRSPSELLYRDELAEAMRAGALRLSLAFTREGATLLPGAGELTLQAGPRRRVEALMLEPSVAHQLFELLRPKSEGGGGAHVYVCGRSGFAQSVLEALKQIFRRHVAQADESTAAQLLYRLAGEGRLVQEIHTEVQATTAEPARIAMSEVAEHNDPQRGYWMVIGDAVYDMTEFMELHPGGRRIVQAYAGMDATHGFARAHHQRADVDAMRESYRIGLLQTHTFDDHAVPLQGPQGWLTVDCTTLHRCLISAVQMVVEMQNALAADQSLQTAQVGDETAPEARTPYKLARALETHRRFTASYLSVLVNETLPNLWRVCRALLFVEQPLDYMACELGKASTAPDVLRTHGLLAAMGEQLEAWLEDPRSPTVQHILESCDARLLRELKAALLAALRELERHGASLRELNRAHVLACCQRAASSLHEYQQQLSALVLAELGQAVDTPLAESPLAQPDTRPVRRLYTGRYWLLEEEPARRLMVLQRTPLALSSLAELREENERVLSCLHEQHRGYGLVVDSRRAPLRNDAAFEDSMARLRSGLTSHFTRTAVLLESSVGTLQVERLERDERRDTLVTRSESSAFKFALGGS